NQMAVPYLNREYEKNIRNEVESLFADYLSRHKFAKTLEVFLQESGYRKQNFSQMSGRPFVQNSHSTIEDIIMNANFRENANKKYLFSTCKSFADAIAENSFRLINLICENSLYANNKNDFKSHERYPHSFMNEGNLNNNRAFVCSQASTHNTDLTHNNSCSMSYETSYTPSRYGLNTCSANTLPSNINTITPYQHVGSSFLCRTGNFSINSGELNGFHPMDGHCLESPCSRANVNCDRSMDHNGCFVPNNSSTPRVIESDLNGKKGTNVLFQNGSLTAQNYYVNTTKVIHSNEDHINSTQYNEHLHRDNKDILSDSGLPNFSNHSSNIPNIVHSSGNVEGREKKTRVNSSSKSTPKGKAIKEGGKTNNASKRKNNSSNESLGKKLQKFDSGSVCRSGVLDFQTTLSPTQFRKAAKDVDLEKEPHLAKQYLPDDSQNEKPFGPDNFLNASKFKNENVRPTNSIEENSLPQTGGISNSSSLNVPGFGRKSLDRDKSASSINDVFKSPTQINSSKNYGNSKKSSSLTNKDDSKISSSQDQSNVSSDNLEGGFDDLTNIDDCFTPYELCQDNSLEYNSDCGFDLDTFYDPVIHPKIRWGQYATPPNEKNDELQLSEAISLVKTIPGFSVSQSVIVGTDYTTKKKQIWGQGRIDSLLQLKSTCRVSAIMINVEYLTPLQQSELYNIFQVPIYDRYNIVLKIFKIYAKTKLAYYQIQLAEIPYIKHRLHYLENNSCNSDILHVTDAINALSKSGLNQKETLRFREQTLRKKIKHCIEMSKNEIIEKKLRQNKKSANNSLTIAIIGYTNVGKTTFIKKITGSSQLNPEDKLFATLDTTIHPFSLPSKNNVFVADTIGFMGSLPIGLFESFSATLMHATSADLLVHLYDLSHPDVFSQKKNVIKSLIDLQFPEKLLNNMINVGNKLDKISNDDKCKLIENGIIDKNDLVISCTTGYGIDELISKIDKTIMNMNNSRVRRFKLKPESKIISYFYENRLVTKEPVVSECGKYLIFDVYLSDSQLNKLAKKTNFKIKQ
uniref:Hflx-type G domain-containing protein n=1 Tax=Strongyloides stercoralis TaxID=6248 RepID=A0AAF5CZX2_STRER